MKLFWILACSLAWTAALADTYTGPGEAVSEAANQTKFAQYCVGTAKSTATPAPNYKNADVIKAAGMLSKVADASFYFYSDVRKQYGLKKGAPAPAAAPQGTTGNAHAFLVILCGEFRDRASMIEAKIGWVNNMVILSADQQHPMNTKVDNIWSEATAYTYGHYIRLSNALFNLRRAAITDRFTFGTQQVDKPVPGFLVCETKYLLAKYAVNNKDALDEKTAAEFDANVKAWGEENCTAKDWAYYYDFRGDSNFKPNSPESNGMIWHSQIMGKNCDTPAKATAGGPLKDADCAGYFSSPFYSRWNAARAGLATWLLRDKIYDQQFANTSFGLTIIPSVDGSKGPYSFQLDGDGTVAGFLPNFNVDTMFSQPDIGFNSVTGLGTQSIDKEMAYTRIRDALNRHTNWYASKYSGFGMQKDQAYSPLVASSYEMSKSDGFTAPGVTVGGSGDGQKHWMYVFKVKKENWYNTANVNKGDTVNFDNNWFDETSLGTDGLAKSERAWDRLGTALEEEMDTILYLHNITTSGQVQPPATK